MEREAIKDVLLSIFEETRGDKVGNLDDQTNLREGMGFDSVDLVCMVLEVQNRLGINLTVGEMEPIRTVGDLLDLLQLRLNKPEKKAA
jgi:acyl carrier protein